LPTSSERSSALKAFVCASFTSTGADVRGDREGLPQYAYHRAAENDITVETWKTQRFRPSFPGFEVDVMDARKNSVQGNTKLGTVRESYQRRK